jgi:2,4-dienoyl-CoA reductase-like NADH-dependent reductase (Old Yellow Enzyme family)
MSPNQPDLFTPLTVGSLNCKNRVVMAPLTRSRAGPGNVPKPLPTCTSLKAIRLASPYRCLIMWR